MTIAVLGRRDFPIDGVVDYCAWLQVAFARRARQFVPIQVPWAEKGWWRALVWLHCEAAAWRGNWVLVQYTALSWSRRGFPLGALAVLWTLRRRGVKCAVMFHDAGAYQGNRFIDRIRRACQLWVMRRAYCLTILSIFAIPVETISWLGKDRAKAAFIPIGANIPEPSHRSQNTCDVVGGPSTVAVFGVTCGDQIAREVADITYAVRQTREKVSPLRLVVIGRGSRETETRLRSALKDSGIGIDVLGILPAEDVTDVLARADVLLFVRGQLSGRRGSAMAGIACGLPIVAYKGPETSYPITEAGVELAPEGDRQALADALTRVLSDETLKQQLRQKSLRAQADWFSWDKIAERYSIVLGDA